MNFPLFLCSAASLCLLVIASNADNGHSDNAEAKRLKLKDLEAALDEPQNVLTKQSDFTAEELKLIKAIFSDLKSARDNNNFSPIGKRNLLDDGDQMRLGATEQRDLINWGQWPKRRHPAFNGAL
uniref:Uncharacterized protein n=1 Tax=Plectus sambesii TaxID=2011161 RepID=A0A914V1P8_9BILA